MLLSVLPSVSLSVVLLTVSFCPSETASVAIFTWLGERRGALTSACAKRLDKEITETRRIIVIIIAEKIVSGILTITR